MLSNSLSLSPTINAPTPAFLQGSALEKQLGKASDAILPETLRPVDSVNKANIQEGKDLDKSKQDTEKSTQKSEDSAKNSNKPDNELDPKEQAELQELQQRDTEVKAHEQAHLSAAGNLAVGSASFTYAKGPDGKRYAIGGEVSIDTSEVAGDPAATAAKADMIRRAALAPAKPSSQDRSVASSAASMKSQAQAELLKLMQEAADTDSDKKQPKKGLLLDGET